METSTPSFPAPAEVEIEISSRNYWASGEISVSHSIDQGGSVALA